MWAALRSRAASVARLAPPAAQRPAAAPAFSSTLQFVRHMSQTARKGYVTMKRRFKGLYGGKHIQFGNKVSFSHRK